MSIARELDRFLLDKTLMTVHFSSPLLLWLHHYSEIADNKKLEYNQSLQGESEKPSPQEKLKL